MAGLLCTAGTRRRGAGVEADPLEQEQERLALDTVEADVGDRRGAVRALGNGPVGTGNGSHQAVLEAVAHFGHPDSRHLPVHQYQVGGPAQADDGRNVLGATAPGPLLAASTEHRGQRHVADH